MNCLRRQKKRSKLSLINYFIKKLTSKNIDIDLLNTIKKTKEGYISDDTAKIKRKIIEAYKKSLEEKQQISDRLMAWGYQPLFISVQNSINIDQIATYLQDKITVIAGPSGVGKSSLINSLIPDINLRVGEVSGKLARGRHTTRHVELFEMPTGGLLADTPGFNQPDLDCSPQELIHYFPEARERLAAAHCRFSDCIHKDEPDCDEFKFCGPSQYQTLENCF